MRQRSAALDALVDRYGEPESISGSWAAFFHRCSEERRTGRGQYPMLLLNLESGWLRCKACGFSRRTDASSLVAKARQVTFEEATGAAGQALRDTVSALTIRGPREYLTKVRGLTEQEIERYSIRTAGPRFLDYVVFPLIEAGEVVSWHARDCRAETHSFPDGHPDRGSRLRWLSPWSNEGCWSRRSCVWGLDRVEEGGTAFVTEGIFDAIYFPTGCAYMGPVPTEVQVAKILDRKPKTIFVASDLDVDVELIRRAFRSKDRYIPVVTWNMPMTEVEGRQRTVRGVPRLTKELADYGQRVAAGLRHIDGIEVPATVADRGEMWWMNMGD